MTGGDVWKHFGFICLIPASAMTGNDRHIQWLQRYLQRCVAEGELSAYFADLPDDHRLVQEFAAFAGSVGSIQPELDQLQAQLAWQRKLEQIVTHSPAVAFQWVRGEGRWRAEYVSPNIQTIMGYDPQQFIDGTLSMSDLVYAKDLDRVLAEAEQQVKAGHLQYTQEYRLLDSRQQVRWFADHTFVEVDASGRACRFQSILLEITDRKQIEASLQVSEQQYRTLVENLNVGVYVSQVKGGVRVLQANPAMAHIFGYESVDQFIREPPVNFYVDAEDRKRFIDRLKTNGFVQEMETRYYRKDGSETWCAVTARAILDASGAIEQIFGIVEDINERKQVAEKLRHDALHDALTGLPNRSMLADHLALAIHRVRRGHAMIGLLFMDLNRFKVLNDSLGHLAGDKLLQEVAHRLSGCVRGNDTVARLGGDEFCILLEDISSTHEVMRVVQRIHDALSRPVELGGKLIYASGAIGIAMGDCHYQSPDEMIRDADTAMYRAKELGKGYEFFDQQMHQQTLARLELESDLQQAMHDRSFVAHYQPIVDLAQMQVVGFEALIRWQRTDGRLLMPGEFIDLAEETGQIVPLGYWILEYACDQLHRWNQLRPADMPWRINVNLSAKQFHQSDMVIQLERLLQITRLDPRQLVLEMTEATFMDVSPSAIDRMHQIKQLGVQLSIDDFGTGYSSFSRLDRLPFDQLKIDRSFIMSIQRSETRRLGVLASMLKLAEAIGVCVIVEGIETEDQLSLLQSLGCAFGQGYYLGRPADPAQVESTLFVVDD